MKAKEMLAGPRLDALVGEKVMGLKVEWRECIHIPAHGTGIRPYYFEGMTQRKENDWQDEELWESVPNYSGNTGAAWQVVERLIELGHEPTIALFDVGLSFDSPDNKWVCVLSGANFSREVQLPFDDSVYSDTAPLAICRAALLAVGVEET